MTYNDYKVLHITLKIEQHELHYKPGVNSGAPGALIDLIHKQWGGLPFNSIVY